MKGHLRFSFSGKPSFGVRLKPKAPRPSLPSANIIAKKTLMDDEFRTETDPNPSHRVAIRPCGGLRWIVGA
jgi:hypothetical protein